MLARTLGEQCALHFDSTYLNGDREKFAVCPPLDCFTFSSPKGLDGSSLVDSLFQSCLYIDDWRGFSFLSGQNSCFLQQHKHFFSCYENLKRAFCVSSQ